MIVIGIDPGFQATAYAVWQGGLRDAGIVRPPKVARSEQILHVADALLRLPRPNVLVVERMVVYPGRRQKGKPSDLIHLSILGGAIVQTLHPSESLLLPTGAEWNRGAPKEVTQARLRECLCPVDLACAEKAAAGHLGHNVWDAIGLAFYGVDHAN